MKFSKDILVTVLAIGILAISGSWSLRAQEETQEENIEIVDQDGQKVDVRKLKFQVQNKDQQKQQFNLRVGDGKIVIVDEDGKPREIDISGAQNIIVSKSVQSQVQDGEEKTRVSGKAIIIGPDGERQEYELSDGFEGFGGNAIIGNGVFEMLPFGREGGGKLPGNFVFGVSPSVGKHMIGVSCSTVSDQLRSHLDLEEGLGLVVVAEPREGTPAADAGIARHDILLNADGNELSATQDLIDAVQAAGDDERAVTLTLIRRGNEIKVDVTPTERKHVTAQVEMLPGEGGRNFRFEKVGPGFVFDKNLPDNLLERMEALDERIKERMEEFTKLHEELRRSMPLREGGDGDQ